MPKTLKRFLPLGLLLIAILGVWVSGLHELVTLDSIKENRDYLQNIVAQHPALSIGAFVFLYSLSTALSLPIATLLTLLGGFLFGGIFGTLYVVISATIGATILFLIARTSFGAALREKASPLYKKVEKNMNDNAASYLLFMRLVPLFPFVLVNIVPALFNIPLRTYVLTTFFGIIPGSFVYVNLGKQLLKINNLSDLVSGQTLLAFGLLGAFALIPSLYKKFKTQKAAS